MSVPSSALGLLLFVVLLWPGFAHSTVRARRFPAQQLTALRETASIVTSSLTSILVVGALFAVARATWPGATPDVGRVLFDPHGYLAAHYVSVIWWGTGMLALAVGGAAGTAAVRMSERIRRTRGLRWLTAAPAVSSMSAWWLAFTEVDWDQVDIYLGCTLDDGSYVSGRLFSFSRAEDDSADRDLLLTTPLRVRPRGATLAEEIPRAQLMTVSARHLVTMTVSYVARPVTPRPATPAPATPSPAAPTVPVAAPPATTPSPAPPRPGSPSPGPSAPTGSVPVRPPAPAPSAPPPGSVP